MHGITVALLAEDRDRLALIEHRVQGTALARVVFSHCGSPVGSTDPVLRQIQDCRAEIVLVDIDSLRWQRAIAVIEVLKASTNDLGIFALGEMSQPSIIVAAMRAGACEYLERSGDSLALEEAFTRFASTRTRLENSPSRARVFTFVNAKGGSGSTTIAVNTALALQQNHGATVLVDFAPLGHAAVHLNARPSFGLSDALQNLHRMDAALLAGFMTITKRDLHLLAGANQMVPIAPTAAELARLFDLLVRHYGYVVVDCSNRSDEITRLLCDLSHQVAIVAQTDVVSLWSVNRLHSWLAESGTRDKLGLIINRYKKIPGFSDEDVRKTTNCKVLWKVPNHYHSVASGIDRGEPIMLQDGEVSRSLRALAAALAGGESTPEGGSVENRAESRKRATARFIISPLRAQH